MKRRFFSIIVILMLVMGLVPSALAAPTAVALQPGQTVTYQQRIPVNIVFIGYKKDSIDRQTLLSQLPRRLTRLRSHRTIARSCRVSERPSWSTTCHRSRGQRAEVFPAHRSSNLQRLPLCHRKLLHHSAVLIQVVELQAQEGVARYSTIYL